jgi:hypothetical protein
MTAIRIETTINSETLHLPQLKPLVGKSVEIIVLEKGAPVVTPGASDWAAVETALRELEDYDFDACREQREAELRRAERNAP